MCYFGRPPPASSCSFGPLWCYYTGRCINTVSAASLSSTPCVLSSTSYACNDFGKTESAVHRPAVATWPLTTADSLVGAFCASPLQCHGSYSQGGRFGLPTPFVSPCFIAGLFVHGTYWGSTCCSCTGSSVSYFGRYLGTFFRPRVAGSNSSRGCGQLSPDLLAPFACMVGSTPPVIPTFGGSGV